MPGTDEVLERGLQGKPEAIEDVTTALPSLIAVQLWSTFGMSLLIFLAGLSIVPKDMLEAARLDGANLMQQWVYIVIPTLQPIIEFVAVVTTIGVLTSIFGLI